MSDRVEELRAELRARLRAICASMSAEDFEAMIERMADVQHRSERQAIDPESWIGTSRRFRTPS